MAGVVVDSGSGRNEFFYVAAAMVAIMIVWSIAVAGRQRAEDEPSLLEYQIDGYEVLNAVEQGLYADLDTAAYEIDSRHDESGGRWPAIEDLAADAVAPFVADQAWQRRGRPSWSLKQSPHALTHAAAYLGRTVEPAVAGSFVIFMQHRHAYAGEPEGRDGLPSAGEPPGPGEVQVDVHQQIWYQAGREAELPADLSEPGLIRKGWKQIAPYSGERELKRLKGSGS